MPPVSFGIGLSDRHLQEAALLYDDAFGLKFQVAIRSRADRISLLEKTFVGDFAITATAKEQLVGLAGLHTADGSLTGGIGARQLFSSLGPIRGLRAIAFFSLYERAPKPGELVMDGIAVHEDCRGRGIGGQLLQRVINYARDKRFATIRLDVIDTNPGAQRLYERHGFVAVRTEKFPYLRWLLGFGASTTMEFRLAH